MRDLLTFLLLILFVPAIAQEINPNVASNELISRINENPNQQIGFYILLKDRLDAQAWNTRFYAQNATLAERAATLIPALKEKAKNTQDPILDLLRNSSDVDQNSIQSYWVTNLIYAEGNKNIISRLSYRDDIDFLETKLEATLLENEDRILEAPPVPNGRENGLTAIKAHKLWEKGYSGNGQIAMIIDTGTEFDHPAIRNNYRGLYFDKSQSYTGASENPKDCHGHGSHVTGTICGIDRATNDTIGVAFNAQWVSGPLFLGVECERDDVLDDIENFEWAMDPDGNPNTIEDMPDVINNSWGSPFFECGNFYYLAETLETLEAVGIAVIWAAGNEGPDLNTTMIQSSINTTLVNNFAVGALNGNTPALNITGFSSRGPSNCPGEGSIKIKPEVSAPGYFVRSCNQFGTYMTISGTSMASPHVAGAIILLKEAFPYLTGEQLKYALYYSATDLGEEGEDNVYGMGIINLENAYNYLVDQGNTPSDPIKENDLILADVFVDDLDCQGTANWSAVIENAGTNAVQNFDIAYKVILDEVVVKEEVFTWTGNLLPGERINYNLPELDGFTGFYDFEVSLQNNGTLLSDDRPYNNLIRRRDIYILNDVPIQAQAIPQESTPCLNTNTLWFLDIPDAIAIDWYIQKTGGFSMHTGPYFHLFPISGNFTFYVEATLESHGGMINAQNTSIENTNRGLSFDAKISFNLKSVKVYNQIAGNRTIGLYDQNNNRIAEKTIDINTIGEVVLDLDFSVPQGRDYQLRLTNGQGLAVDSEPSYPYNLGDIAFITKSTAPSNPQSKYYYFYDWVIHHARACQRTPIHLEMQATENPPSAAFTPSATIVNIGALENIEFTNSSSNSVEYLWNFGDGTTSTEENPQHSYSSTGLYTVSLAAINADGCTDIEVIEIEAVLETATINQEASNQIKIFPNPTKDLINVQFDFDVTQNVKISIIDLLGRSLATQTKKDYQKDLIQLDLKNNSQGVYHVIFEFNDQKVIKRIVKM